jgi:predicted DsbA family dithiol-disulfide isomerase
MALHVDVLSDVMCPWCYIGKRRLEKAVAGFGGPVKVRWLPFQLNPTMPQEGISRRVYRTKKFGSWERSLELDARLVAVGEAEGIPFAFDRIERTPNTLNAHRLVGLADKEGIQDAAVEALFRAYFTEGRDISNRQTLLDVVAEGGLDRGKAETMLNGEDGLEAIKGADELSRRFRVRYMLRYREKLTLFLRHAGAPLDNNVCERALKQVILHRKNALFYKTRNGARVGDLFMSLIYTCQLNEINPFDYLTQLQRHADQLAAGPQLCMPSNYRETLTNESGAQPQ